MREVDRYGNEVTCKSGRPKYMSICMVCYRKVVIHCDQCSLTITGCACTLAERIEKEGKN